MTNFHNDIFETKRNRKPTIFRPPKKLGLLDKNIRHNYVTTKSLSRNVVVTNEGTVNCEMTMIVV